MLGLYLHIPFCQAICSYCNFNRGLFDAAVKQRYVAALEREIRTAGDGRPADTIFFGGGTPSLLDPADVRGLIAACRDVYDLAPDAEITLETNPETATSSRLEQFLEAGVNRISFGVQSFDDGELQRLGRIHSAAKAREAVDAARQVGCGNLNLDLMLWLPGQSRASWSQTVRQTIAIAPDHVSLYLLELYPNAPLKETMARASSAGPAWLQAADDAAADMYLEGLALLDEAGFEQYEISNVSRPGYQCRHNVKYWQSGAWRGFGCGAHSTMDGSRWQNVSATTDYVDRVSAGRSVQVNLQSLPAGGRVEEALFTGLRLMSGIDIRNFSARFGVDPWSRYGHLLRPYVDDGFMWAESGRFGLHRRGMLVANEILAIFV